MAHLLRADSGRSLGIFAAAAGIAIAAAAIPGFICDVRWLIVALMLLLIVSPAFLLFLLMKHGTRGCNPLNLPLHTLTFTPTEIVLTQLEESIGEDGETQLLPTREHRFPLPTPSPYTTDGRSLRIPTGNGLLIAPYTGFPSEDALRAAVAMLR